ncbi:MAG: efflux RND transporter periplasmic adaptor subunit [Bdellovibrionales bacterium]|nr:efflux RND transporter periplasmic adaptor subunit [Bdellovibrionales bacterium]
MKNISLIVITLFILTSCGAKVEVTAIKIGKGVVESTVTTTNSGTVEAKDQAELAFGTPGRISKIHVNLGDVVKKGAIIAELENADLRAVYNETLKDFERSQELFKNGLVSVASTDGVSRAREVAKITLDKTIIKAPFDGMITALNLKVGEFYQSGGSLSSADKKIDVQIIDLKTRLIKGEIDEVDLQKIKIGQSARVKIPAMKNKIIKARLTKVVPFVSTVKDQDRTSQIELEILDDQGLIPVGASADVEIVVEEKANANILPAMVLTGVGANRSVFIVDGSKLVKRAVKIGTGNYERVEILDGVKPTDLIAKPLEGVELTEGMKVKVKEANWL